MPMQRNRYPTNWVEIARQVKDAAGWRCEWCSIRHGTLRTSAKGKPFREVMTTAHLDRDYDNPEPRLACLCTRCHLLYDQPDHVKNAILTRRRKKRERLNQMYGNRSLFEMQYVNENESKEAL